jgi:uncharacterized RDD family membrane protein YckC
VSCPSCGAALPSLTDACLSCSRRNAPSVEGNLAPDLARIIPSRLEPSRELPGRKRREPTWRDEVKQRVQERRRQRLGDELPLFAEATSALDVALDGDPDLALVPLVEPEPRSRVTGGPSAALDDRDDINDRSADVASGEDGPRLVWSTPPPQMSVGAQSSASVWSLGDEGEAEDDAADEPVAAPRGRIDRPVTLGSPLASSLLDDEEEEPAVAPLESPAAWSERAQAALFDLGVLGMLWAVVVYFASRAAGSVGALRAVWPPLVGYLAFLGVLYAVYFTGTCGRTIGKIVCGLRVVDVAGRPPGYATALARTLLGTVGIVVGMVALIPIFFDPARRALHDRLLRTRVVKY